MINLEGIIATNFNARILRSSDLVSDGARAVSVNRYRYIF